MHNEVLICADKISQKCSHYCVTDVYIMHTLFHSIKKYDQGPKVWSSVTGRVDPDAQIIQWDGDFEYFIWAVYIIPENVKEINQIKSILVFLFLCVFLFRVLCKIRTCLSRLPFLPARLLANTILLLLLLSLPTIVVCI